MMGWKVYRFIVEQVSIFLGLGVALVLPELSTRGKVGMILIAISIIFFAHRESLKRIEERFGANNV